jgi:hypothetical protein
VVSALLKLPDDDVTVADRTCGPSLRAPYTASAKVTVPSTTVSAPISATPSKSVTTAPSVSLSNVTSSESPASTGDFVGLVNTRLGTLVSTVTVSDGVAGGWPLLLFAPSRATA